MKTSNRKRPAFALALLACVINAATLSTASAHSDEDSPGHGLTAQFEIDYLKFIIDHHFSALRMTELAAGTSAGQSSPRKGVPNTPGFPPSQQKATMRDLISMAVKANRMQRQEIAEAQAFLRDFYGTTYQPTIRPENQQMIALLDSIPAGRDFDHHFMETFARHHYTAVVRSVDCVVGSDLRHRDLERYCGDIVEAQLKEINMLREMLCASFQICDYQPFTDPKGQHSGPQD